MSGLEEYLASEYRQDIQDVEDIEATFREVATTFGATFLNGQWPYQVKASQPIIIKSRDPSHGTSAMILSAVGKLLGLCEMHTPAYVRKTFLADKGLCKKWRQAAALLARSIAKRKGTYSKSFGKHDPLTISHLSDLVRSLNASRTSISSPGIHRYIPSVVSRIEKLAKADPSQEASFKSKLGATKFAISGFVALRVVRAYCDLFNLKHFPNSAYRKFFESRLHDHLSFSRIPDSRFDPAELAFCLEGLLLCAPESVDPPLFEQVLKVLSDKQNTSAHWRPNTPFLSEDRGQIMLPLSVEGANSLLRAIAIMDGDRLDGAFAPMALPMFRRFWRWLRARKVQFALGQVQLTGWHSEHINDPDVIHLWDTSQVLDFLIGYRDLLHRHIARTTLVESRALVREPKVQVGKWSHVWEKFEPIRSPSDLSSVYEALKREFVDEWASNEPQNYSMLLYGPPGTGKSTVAENLADQLGARMITITVSDFLGSGGAMVEARAKAVFQMLEAQSGAVILFDEIDAFLLDRDSQHYRDQDTLFQFLTPGMLTKINDLRKLKRSIFIIATNYANRIDPAIKRPGRIDRKYLLLPPDLYKRAKILAEFLQDRPLPIGRLKFFALARASLYLGYNDIAGAVAKAGGPAANPARLYAELKSAARSTSHTHYFDRVDTESQFPLDELKALFTFAGEAGAARRVNQEIRRLPRAKRTALASALAR